MKPSGGTSLVMSAYIELKTRSKGKADFMK